MKICLFTVDFPPMLGGIPEFSRSFSYYASLSSDVDHVQVIAPNNMIKNVENPSSKLSITRDNKKSFFRIALFLVESVFRFRTYDVFHATSVFPCGFVVLLVGKYILRKPVFVTFYGTDMLSTLGSRKTKWLKRWTLKHATKAVAFSNSTRDEVSKQLSISLQNLEVIYYPISDEPVKIPKEVSNALRETHGIKQDDFVVLFVGHLVRRKGPEDLLKAISLIKDEKVKLLFVGAGMIEKELHAQTIQLGLQSRVIFVGAQDAKPFYTLANVLCMPSFFFKEEGDIEGLGIVFLEAQQYGVPVLGTRSGGIPEALLDEGSGFLVPERDSEALAEKIKLLAGDEGLQKRLGERGKQFVREKFDWRKSIRGHIAMYHSAL